MYHWGITEFLSVTHAFFCKSDNPRLQIITALWPVLVSKATEGRRLSYQDSRPQEWSPVSALTRLIITSKPDDHHNKTSPSCEIIINHRTVIVIFCILMLLRFLAVVTTSFCTIYRVCTDPGKVWKVTECDVEIFQALKSLENDERYGRIVKTMRLTWKI